MSLIVLSLGSGLLGLTAGLAAGISGVSIFGIPAAGALGLAAYTLGAGRWRPVLQLLWSAANLEYWN